MDKSRPKTMDIATPRRNDTSRRRGKMTRKQVIVAVVSIIMVVSAIAGLYSYQHRNDQTVLNDHYQVVYLLTGQVYFGKLQNTSGEYLTLKKVYTLENKTGAAATDNTSNILQVTRQVYGPEDSMAIRADQVQFWQNLRTDSKVAQAIDSVNK